MLSGNPLYLILHMIKVLLSLVAFSLKTLLLKPEIFKYFWPYLALEESLTPHKCDNLLKTRYQNGQRFVRMHAVNKA